MMDGLVEQVIDPLVWTLPPMPTGWAPPETLIDMDTPRPQVIVTTLSTHTDPVKTAR